MIIDRLISYCKESVDETKELINPAYRGLDREVRSPNGKLSTLRAEFGKLILEIGISQSDRKFRKRLSKKAGIQEIQIPEKEIGEVKEKRRILSGR